MSKSKKTFRQMTEKKSHDPIMERVAEKVGLSATTLRRAMYVLKRKDIFPDICRKWENEEIEVYTAYKMVKRAEEERTLKFILLFEKEKGRIPSLAELIDFVKEKEGSK